MGKVQRKVARSASADIVIPVYNAVDKLDKCLKALENSLTLAYPENFENVRYLSSKDDPSGYQRLDTNIFLIDDCSSEKLPPISDYPNLNIKLTRNRDNMGFAASCNLAAKQGSSEIIVFLNSDTEMQPGWLHNFLGLFKHDPLVGIQGAKLIFPLNGNDPRRPSGRIQHAGICFGPDKVPRHAFIGWTPDNWKVNRILNVQAVTGACMAIRRSVFNQLKGFNTVYGSGTFEDIELCLNCCNLDKLVVYNPTVVGYHYGGGSGGQFPYNQNLQTFMQRNGQSIIWDEWAIL